MSDTLFVRARRHPGLLAALLNRVSGIALSIFLPLHFLALGLALSGAPRLERFLALTRNSLMETLEAALIAALALHFACGLRILAIEFLDFREKTAITVAACIGFGLFFGLFYLTSIPMGG